MASRLSCRRFMALGYCPDHFSVTVFNCFLAASSSAAVQIVFKSLAKAFISLFATYLSVFLTICTMQRCCSVFGNAAEIVFSTYRIKICRLACPPIIIISSSRHFCKKMFCGTNRQYHICPFLRFSKIILLSTNLFYLSQLSQFGHYLLISLYSTLPDYL